MLCENMICTELVASNESIGMLILLVLVKYMVACVVWFFFPQLIFESFLLRYDLKLKALDWLIIIGAVVVYMDFVSLN